MKVRHHEGRVFLDTGISVEDVTELVYRIDNEQSRLYSGDPWANLGGDMDPTPMAPMLMRLLGAFFPNTLAGTRVGRCSAIAVPAADLKVSFRNFLLPTAFFVSFCMAICFSVASL